MILYGEPLERLIARDDKPLSEKEAGREEKRVRGIVRKREREGEEKRKKRLAKEEEKEREESTDFLAEFTEAFSFSLAGIELVEGHEVYVIEAEPRLRYEPHDKFLKTVQHFHFQAWIDKLETQWVKLNAECIKDFSIGLFLGRVSKGTSFMIEETKVNDEVWLPKRYLIRVRGRVLLSSTQLSTINMTFSDYKKFRANTKIVPLGEGKE